MSRQPFTLCVYVCGCKSSQKKFPRRSVCWSKALCYTHRRFFINSTTKTSLKICNFVGIVAATINITRSYNLVSWFCPVFIICFVPCLLAKHVSPVICFGQMAMNKRSTTAPLTYRCLIYYYSINIFYFFQKVEFPPSNPITSLILAVNQLCFCRYLVGVPPKAAR